MNIFTEGNQGNEALLGLRHQRQKRAAWKFGVK
jgi:hypothetical protein